MNEYIMWWETKIFEGLMIFLAFALGSFVMYWLVGFFEKLVKKTKSDLDDRLIKASKLPARYLLLVIGAYIAIKHIGWSWSWKKLTVEVAFFSLVALIVSFAISRLAKALIRYYAEARGGERFNQTMLTFIRKVISAVIYSLALLLILSHAGVEIGPLLAGMGVAGIAIALGLQEPLSNIFSAFFLVLDKSVNIGDWIELENGTKAYIEDISWRSVRIRTRDGNTVIVPNSVFISQQIASYDYPERPLFISLRIGVAYGSDLEQVEKTALQATQAVIEEMKVEIFYDNPRVRFREFGDSAILFDIRLKIDQAKNEAKIKHELIKRIKKDFAAAGIEIPFPQRVIYMKKN